MKKYYIAYGSNLNLKQMKMRCPDSKLIGTGILDNYELLFRGNGHDAVATIEQKAGGKVPIGIFEISDKDELSLDRYEGFPHLYTKRYVNIKSQNVDDIAMIYIMNDGHSYGLPSQFYYSTIKQGYKDCQLDLKYLEKAIENMNDIIEEMEIKEKYPLGYKDVRK